MLGGMYMYAYAYVVSVYVMIFPIHYMSLPKEDKPSAPTNNANGVPSNKNPECPPYLPGFTL